MRHREALTPRQRALVLFVLSYREQNRRSPTYGEIGDALGVCKVTVFEHVEALERKGALRRERGAHRSLRIARPVARELETERGASCP